MKRFLFIALWLASVIVPRAQIMSARFDSASFGADERGVIDSTGAFKAALASLGNGATLTIPNGVFLVGQIDVTNSNFTIEGPGILKCSRALDTWLKFTGTNITFRGVTLDGAYLGKNLLIVGPFSSDVEFNGLKVKRAQINAANGDLNSVMDMVRVTRGCQRIAFRHCAFSDATCPIGTSVGGLRAIRCAAFSTVALTDADRFDDITIEDCTFDSIGLDQTSADCIVFQDFPANSDGELICNFIISNCRFRDFGRRAIKLSIGGGVVSGNRITFHNTGTPGNTYAGISLYGSSATITGNTINGSNVNGTNVGAAYRGIEVASLPVTGRARANTVSGNTITMDPNGQSQSDGIFLGSVLNCTVTGNTVKNSRFGIRMAGKSQFSSIVGNVTAGSGLAGVFLTSDADPASDYYTLSPSDISLAANVITDSTGNGVQVDAGCLRIQTTGTTGAATFGLVSYGSGVTGERAANYGSVGPITATSSSTSYYGSWIASTTAPHLRLEGPFANNLFTYDDNTQIIGIGRSAGAVSLLGMVRVAAGAVTITGGTGAPSSSQPNGSIYLRTDGTGPNLYVRENGAWAAK